MLPPEVSLWFAVQVTPQHEQKVAVQLKYKDQETFVPTYALRTRWSDRAKVVQRPLFPGYVFCRTKRSSFGFVLNTPGVVRIISFGAHAAPIPDYDIDALRQAIASGRELLTVPYLSVGQKVRVQSGPLSGITGIVARRNNRDRIVLSVDLIMKSISVDIDVSDLRPLPAAS